MPAGLGRWIIEPRMSEISTPKSATGLVYGALLVLSFGVVVGMAVGSYPLQPFDSAARAVLFELRVPRVLAALLVGASLGLGGAAMQGWFRNPLVEPGLLGVSAGAALMAAIALLLLPQALQDRLPALTFGGIAVAAFLGAFGVVLILAALRHRLQDTTQLLLIGIAINAATAAAIGVLSALAPVDRLRSFVLWGLASFDRLAAEQLLPLLLASAWMAWRLLPIGTTLDALALGPRAAEHLGVDTRRAEQRLLFALAIGVGAATAVAGPLVFVGLLAPHLARLWGVERHGQLLPISALLGALLTVWADIAGRLVLAPRELPAGVFTQLAGALLFLLLLRRSAVVSR